MDEKRQGQQSGAQSPSGGTRPDDTTKDIEGRTVQVIWTDGDRSGVVYAWKAPEN